MTNAVAQPDLFHSPGEWHFDGPPHNHIVWCGPDQRVCFLTSDGPSTANARLIAAAPALLDALRLLIDAPELEMDEPVSIYTARVLDKARTAIGKATGAA